MSKLAHRALGRFVLRTPVLPFDVLHSWTGDRAMLRGLVDDPAVREALYVASPELDAQIAAWQKEPDSPAGVAVERSLVRYLSRMASRSTPFGLFAAVSVGTVDETGATTLDLPARAAATRHTRLDNDYLFALCSDLVRDGAIRAALRYRPNQSLYAAAGRLRYAEARLAGPVRAYHLVAVDRTPYLDALLDRANAPGGATLAELAAVLCADPEITADEATQFIGEVIDAQLLVAELAPAVTGREPTDGIIDTLAAAGLDELAAPLRDARAAIRAIDDAPPGVPAGAYRAIEHALRDRLPAKVEPSRLFQVDLFKPAPGVQLGEAVMGELARGIELLHALAPGGEDAQWARFREKFTARYETREVPLVEVLDEEVGIGFGDAGQAAGNAPLLADLAFRGRAGTRQVTFDRRETHLLGLVAGAIRTGALEVELSDADVEALSTKSPAPLPDVVCAAATLIGASAGAVAAGDFQLRLNHVGGGANLLGRFCHGSPEVTALTAEALRAEEAARPDAVFAEIVHLPEGRVGNILLRPVLRAYEIPFLGGSGADEDHRIGVADLTVSVDGDRVVLRSRRLGREVIPRLTTAHNYSARSLTVYRFLCSHAHQNIGNAYFTWGALDAFPFLPRVRRGKLILSRARWVLTAADLAPLEEAFAGANTAPAGAKKTPDQIRALRERVLAAVAALRARLGLPRWVVVADGDNELPVDLDNELMVDSAAALLKGRPVATLYELLPAHDGLALRSPEGAFAHELMVMYARPAPAPKPKVAPPPPADIARRFAPGSEWLYLKLYTGTATADALLREAIAPAVEAAIANGLCDSWFFIRYSDPDWHVRLRFHGDPQKLTGELLPYLHRALAPAVADGLVWRIQVDTYEREVERYGGAAGIELAEQLFRADSDACLAIVAACEGDAGADAAWRLALRGIDQLLDDLGMSLAEKLAAMTAARDGFGAEFGLDTALQKQLGDKYRKHGKELAALLAAPSDAPDHPFAPALAAFGARSRAVRPIAAQLRAAIAAGAVPLSLDDLAGSYVHMHANRMIRSNARAHELVLYDLLRRHYDGILARERAAAKRAKPEAA
ncbi:MAG: lantibiotic dehydratase [Deltaproteobacteria bacterium]|nr:lantibiotic dehydratase [Deltaproteobacteria bacterium]